MEVLFTWVLIFIALKNISTEVTMSDLIIEHLTFPGEKFNQPLIVHACVSIFSVCALTELDRRPPAMWEEPQWRGPSHDGSLSVPVGLCG